MQYLILIGVTAMMILYAVIISECLRHPEWEHAARTLPAFSLAPMIATDFGENIGSKGGRCRVVTSTWPREGF